MSNESSGHIAYGWCFRQQNGLEWDKVEPLVQKAVDSARHALGLDAGQYLRAGSSRIVFPYLKPDTPDFYFVGVMLETPYWYEEGTHFQRLWSERDPYTKQTKLLALFRSPDQILDVVAGRLPFESLIDRLGGDTPLSPAAKHFIIGTFWG